MKVYIIVEKNLLCKTVRKVGQNLTEKQTMNFNARYNLRRKPKHPSINTKIDEGVPA